jgi:prephenate dehydrogenase
VSVAVLNPLSSASPPDLETRVARRKQELISEIVEHKKNSSRTGAAEAIDKLKARLSELANIVKEGVVDGWANVGSSAKTKLDEWIAK